MIGAMSKDASIAEIFPPHSVEARFVVAMSMAKNGIERALRDVRRAAEKDAPDFTYRVLLSTGHLVEALDSLSAYCERFETVRSLLECVSPSGQERLKVARGTLQRVGAEALQHARNNTFHYPSPRTNYSPSSDAQLEAVLATMSDTRASIYSDADGHVTLEFADEVALALSMGKHAPTNEEITAQFELTRDGALAFVAWAYALVNAYVEINELSLGEPEVISDAPGSGHLGPPAAT